MHTYIFLSRKNYIQVDTNLLVAEFGANTNPKSALILLKLDQIARFWHGLSGLEKSKQYI